MTDRIKGFMVALDTDIREDDANTLASAILQLRGVVGIEYLSTNVDDYINRARIRRELVDRLYKVLAEKP